MKFKLSTLDNVYVYLTKDNTPVILTEVNFLSKKPLRGLTIKPFSDDSNKLFIEDGSWSYYGSFLFTKETCDLDLTDKYCLELGKATHPQIVDKLKHLQFVQDRDSRDHAKKEQKSSEPILSKEEILNIVERLIRKL